MCELGVFRLKTGNEKPGAVSQINAEIAHVRNQTDENFDFRFDLLLQK